jgi:hypothetical protein
MTGDPQDLLDELHRRVHPPAQVDQAALAAAVDRVLADRERRQAEAAAQAERERAEALAIGGPCKYCGITTSWEHDRVADRPEPRWYAGVCAGCNGDAQWTDAGVARTDGERRDAVLRRLLPPEVTRWHALGYLAERSGFRWWHEVPGAATSATERFAYVDRHALAARLAPSPPQYEAGDPCPRCGVQSLWRTVSGPASAYDPHSGTVEVLHCAGCGRFAELEDLAVWATGLTRHAFRSLGQAAEAVLGVHWWAEHPAGGRAKPPQPCTTPFGYLDRAAARAAAYRVLGRGAWAELAFGGPIAHQAARAAYEAAAAGPG